MTAKYEQCRYLRRNDEQCTGEAIAPEGGVYLCAKHTARLIIQVKEATNAKKRADQR